MSVDRLHDTGNNTVYIPLPVPVCRWRGERGGAVGNERCGWDENPSMDPFG